MKIEIAFKKIHKVLLETKSLPSSYDGEKLNLLTQYNEFVRKETYFILMDENSLFFGVRSSLSSSPPLLLWGPRGRKKT